MIDAAAAPAGAETRWNPQPPPAAEPRRGRRQSRRARRKAPDGARPGRVEPIIPLVHAPDDPGPDLGLEAIRFRK